jgi:serine/threonine protein kinase/tetratricopeptide (TPR) repeat protein
LANEGTGKDLNRLAAARWQQVERFYHAALARPAAERAVFLDSTCGHDEVLRLEIESMLRYEPRARQFLETPVLSTHPMHAGLLLNEVRRDEEARVPGNLVGRTFGVYELKALIALGGMGEVYRAIDTRLNRAVAVKVLPEHLSNDPERRERFKREAKIVSGLNHPHICRLYDLGAHDGIEYMVLELIEGETLQSRLACGPLPLSEALEYAIQVAEALDEAHKQGVVHRDLKPNNVMLTASGVTLLDFGLAIRCTPPAGITLDAHSTDGLEGLTIAGRIMGTPQYVSPEQLEGKPADSRSDIFAFGALAYEMFTGQQAFQGANSARLISAILQDEPRPISACVPNMSPAIARTLTRCLAKHPEDRWQTANELVHNLRSVGIAAVSPANLLHASRARRSLNRVNRSGTIAAVLVALLGLGVLALHWHTRAPAGAARIQSIAVLPLENLSRDPQEEYFADGMTEALIGGLSKISALHVISRTSVMHYKGTKATVPEIARELKVDGVVEGSVQRVGDRVKITAQLIRAANDTHLWANSYDRGATDVLALQEEVARAIAEEIKVTVTPHELQRLAGARPVNPQVLELCLRARHISADMSSNDAVNAINLAQEAINIDANYAPAYEALALAYYSASNLTLPPREAMPKARAAAEKALALDPTLSAARATLGLVAEGYDWNWPEAERSFRRALSDNPGQSSSHAWYGNYLSDIGRSEEAIQELERARQLDPLSVEVNYALGRALLSARQFDRAIQQFRETLRLDPTSYLVMWISAQAYECKGDFPEALRWYRKARQWEDNPLLLAQIGGVYTRMGDQHGARIILGQLQRRSVRQHVPPDAFGILYFHLGEKDKAFLYLNQAFDERAEDLIEYKVAPWIDPLRSDPRFQDLLRRMKFPD